MKTVYFIKPVGMETPIKIGCSFSPDQRRETLEFWSPFPLEVVARYDGGHNVERQFHMMFADSHERHEWFTRTPRLADVIDRINAGTFDAAELPDGARLPVKKKSLTYMTPGWKYQRSVCMRIDHILSPLDWQDRRQFDKRLQSDLECLDEAGVVEAKARIEPQIADMRRDVAGLIALRTAQPPITRASSQRVAKVPGAFRGSGDGGL